LQSADDAAARPTRATNPPPASRFFAACPRSRLRIHRAQYCIGRNYAEHARELGNEVPNEEPVIFLKSAAALRPLDGGDIAFADETFHHEIELVVLVGAQTPLGALAPGGEHAVIAAVGLGLDLTRRGKQTELKKAGLPWTVSKSFAGSALLSPMLPAAEVDLDDVSFALQVNGEERQRGHVNQMIFSIAHQLRYLNALTPLLPGDLVFTGTPEGVGPIRKGDALVLRYLSGAATLPSYDGVL